MTGFPKAEKSTELKTEEDKSETEMEREKNRSNKCAILAAGGASLLTAFVVIAVVISLYYGTSICQARNTPKTEKFFLIISESQSTGKVEVKDTERVIITETRTPNQTLHDTVTLQDFNRKLQAIKDLDRNECFVSTFDILFEEAKATVQGNETVFDLENYDTRTTVRSKETIPFQLAELALGSHVVEFCRNLPIYWLTDAKGPDFCAEFELSKSCLAVWKRGRNQPAVNCIYCELLLYLPQAMHEYEDDGMLRSRSVSV